MKLSWLLPGYGVDEPETGIEGGDWCQTRPMGLTKGGLPPFSRLPGTLDRLPGRTGGSSGGVRDILSHRANLRARSSSLERPFDACSDSGCHKNIPDVTDGGFDR